MDYDPIKDEWTYCSSMAMGLLKINFTLTSDEITGIAAHELAHCRHGDVSDEHIYHYLGCLGTASLAWGYVDSSIIRSMVKKRLEKSIRKELPETRIQKILSTLTSKSTFLFHRSKIVSPLLLLFHLSNVRAFNQASQHAECAADDFSTQICFSGNGLISGLTKLDASIAFEPSTTLALLALPALVIFAPYLIWTMLKGPSHPDTTDRIARIKRLHSQQHHFYDKNISLHFIARRAPHLFPCFAQKMLPNPSIKHSKNLFSL